MRQQSFSPVMSDGGNISVPTDASGTAYALYDHVPLAQLTIINDTGTVLEWRQDAAGVAMPIADGDSFTIFGIGRADQIGVRRKDNSATPVTVKARWEI